MAGLSSSQERVLGALKEKPLRAQDIAAGLGVDPSAVRRHLDNLIALELVESYDLIEGPGRPKRFFRLTGAGKENGPRNYPLLLASLMQKVAKGEGRRQLFRYLESIASDLAGPDARNADARKRLDLLLARYNALGFDAQLETTGGRTVLVQRNCPFLSVAAGDPEGVCQHLDEGMARALLPGARVELKASMAKGDAVCRHLLAKLGQKS